MEGYTYCMRHLLWNVFFLAEGFTTFPRKGKILDSPDPLWKTVPYLDPLDRECFGHRSQASSRWIIVVTVVQRSKIDLLM